MQRPWSSGGPDAGGVAARPTERTGPGGLRRLGLLSHPRQGSQTDFRSLLRPEDAARLKESGSQRQVHKLSDDISEEMGPTPWSRGAPADASKQTASLQPRHLSAASCFAWWKGTVPVRTPASSGSDPGIDTRPE